MFRIDETLSSFLLFELRRSNVIYVNIICRYVCMNVYIETHILMDVISLVLLSLSKDVALKYLCFTSTPA